MLEARAARRAASSIPVDVVTWLRVALKAVQEGGNQLSIVHVHKGVCLVFMRDNYQGEELYGKGDVILFSGNAADCSGILQRW